MARNWAIAIGINHYDSLKDLDYAKGDAEAIQKWCKNPNEGNFNRVFLFTGDSPDIPATPTPISTKPTYEIEELQQGAFTYALLEALRFQGTDNCATVERLYDRLRYRVSQIVQQYKNTSQTPYAVVEPATKYHLILLPQQATLRDAETLKLDAFREQMQQNYQLAEQFWIRVLAISPADRDAINGIKYLARLDFDRDRVSEDSRELRSFGAGSRYKYATSNRESGFISGDKIIANNSITTEFS